MWGQLPIGIEVKDQVQQDAVDWYNQYFGKEIFVKGDQVKVDIEKNCYPALSGQTDVHWNAFHELDGAHICIAESIVGLPSDKAYYYRAVFIHEMTHSLGFIGHTDVQGIMQKNRIKNVVSFDSIKEKFDRDVDVLAWLKDAYDIEPTKGE